MTHLDPETRREVSVLSLGLIIACACALLLAWLTHTMLAGEVALFDETVRGWVYGRWTWSLPFMKVCTFVGGPTVLGIAAIAVFVALWRHRCRHEDGLLVSAMAGALILGMALKEVFQRPRPTPFYNLEKPLTWSYPSGHALGSFCFFIALAMVLTPFLRGGRRVAAWVICLAMVGLVGFSRIYLGVHWPSDVVAGWLTGSIWMSAVWIAFEHLPRSSSPASTAEEPGH